MKYYRVPAHGPVNWAEVIRYNERLPKELPFTPKPAPYKPKKQALRPGL